MWSQRCGASVWKLKEPTCPSTSNLSYFHCVDSSSTQLPRAVDLWPLIVSESGLENQTHKREYYKPDISEMYIYMQDVTILLLLWCYCDHNKFSPIDNFLKFSSKQSVLLYSVLKWQSFLHCLVVICCAIHFFNTWIRLFSRPWTEKHNYTWFVLWAFLIGSTIYNDFLTIIAKLTQAHTHFEYFRLRLFEALSHTTSMKSSFLINSIKINITSNSNMSVLYVFSGFNFVKFKVG